MMGPLFRVIRSIAETGTFEKMHQVVPTLFPDEFSLLSQDMLRQLATVAVNDLRVSLLVNDQRFLGIILQELNSLVTKHGILTQDQAEALQQCIVLTLLPGSQNSSSGLKGTAEAK